MNKKIDTFFRVILILNLFLFSFVLYKMEIRDNDFKYFNETRGDNLMGIYYHDSYYCVWTKDRTEENIAKTDTHEQCHNLINLNKRHFCGWGIG